MSDKREAFYDPEEILREVVEKIAALKGRGGDVDYLTFVADGEPTLDINLGKEIESLKSLGIKVAVISNSSLLWGADVRDDLRKADWVSLKIDTVDPETWRRVNRPHGALVISEIFRGISRFAGTYRGDLVTETMLCRGINDDERELNKTARFVADLYPRWSYISIPTRPPAERNVKPPTERGLHLAFQIFNEPAIRAEYLIGYEGTAFAFTGNAENDLLSITSVHPMRKDGVVELLKKANAEWGVVDKLIKEGALMELEYRGNVFYVRKLRK